MWRGTVAANPRRNDSSFPETINHDLDLPAQPQRECCLLLKAARMRIVGASHRFHAQAVDVVLVITPAAALRAAADAHDRERRHARVADVVRMMLMAVQPQRD